MAGTIQVVAIVPEPTQLSLRTPLPLEVPAPKEHSRQSTEGLLNRWGAQICPVLKRRNEAQRRGLICLISRGPNCPSVQACQNSECLLLCFPAFSSTGIMRTSFGTVNHNLQHYFVFFSLHTLLLVIPPRDSCKRHSIKKVGKLEEVKSLTTNQRGEFKGLQKVDSRSHIHPHRVCRACKFK